MHTEGKLRFGETYTRTSSSHTTTHRTVVTTTYAPVYEAEHRYWSDGRHEWDAEVYLGDLPVVVDEGQIQIADPTRVDATSGPPPADVPPAP